MCKIRLRYLAVAIRTDFGRGGVLLQYMCDIILCYRRVPTEGEEKVQTFFYENGKKRYDDGEKFGRGIRAEWKISRQQYDSTLVTGSAWTAVMMDFRSETHYTRAARVRTIIL